MQQSRQAAPGRNLARYLGIVPGDGVADLVRSCVAGLSLAPGDVESVEGLFKMRTEIDSRDELPGMLDGSMAPMTLDAILARMITEGKAMVHDDGTLVWICAEGNQRLLDSIKRSKPL